MKYTNYFGFFIGFSYLCRDIKVKNEQIREILTLYQEEHHA